MSNSLFSKSYLKMQAMNCESFILKYLRKIIAAYCIKHMCKKEKQNLSHFIIWFLKCYPKKLRKFLGFIRFTFEHFLEILWILYCNTVQSLLISESQGEAPNSRMKVRPPRQFWFCKLGIKIWYIFLFLFNADIICTPHQ